MHRVRTGLAPIYERALALQRVADVLVVEPLADAQSVGAQSGVPVSAAAQSGALASADAEVVAAVGNHCNNHSTANRHNTPRHYMLHWDRMLKY
jgi:hypothetical protein